MAQLTVELSDTERGSLFMALAVLAVLQPGRDEMHARLAALFGGACIYPSCKEAFLAESPNVARDLLVAYLREHERTCTKPPGQCQEVGGVLGWLAHCLGATREDLVRLQGELVHYDLTCTGGDDHIHRPERSVSHDPQGA